YGVNEFLCEVERLVSEGKAARDDDGYLPVVITLPGVQPAESLFFQAWSKKLDADADARYRTTPGVPLDQLAADLYEYLNAPVGVNPGPVNPKVAENVDWAAVRAAVTCPGAAAPHAAPFKVRYFEAGNETRAPGWGKLYAELNLVPIATALRRVQAAIPGAKLEIGAVMLDNFAAYLDGWRRWQTDVLAFTGGVGGPNSACALADGAKVACLDAWIMHYYTPGNWGAAHGVDLRANSDVLETTRRLPAGSYRFEYTAAADNSGGSPSLKLEVIAGGETRLTQTNAALSTAAARNPATAAVTFASAADVTVRLTPSGVGTGGGGPISVYPLLAAIRTDAAGRAEYFDLTMARAAHLAAMSAALYDEPQLNDPSLAGLPIWVTEMHPEIEAPASQVQGVAMRDALQLAMAYFVLIRSGNATMAQIWEAFQQEWYGLVEGVAFDPREGRGLARAESRLRPT
ncbi:MAG: hypothetical protein K8I02_09700, partial [Candidatus Methylomirabilis sp.]|nr:hypothetical protein [Deltaproteobacteria bacterium]